MKVIYRISDGGYPKEKPDYITKINCLKNALKHFNQEDFLLIMDGVSDNLKSEIEKIYSGKAQLVSIGNGAGTFNLALSHVLGQTEIFVLENDEIVYSNSCDFVMAVKYIAKKHNIEVEFFLDSMSCGNSIESIFADFNRSLDLINLYGSEDD
jgi:hypothetical protein